MVCGESIGKQRLETVEHTETRVESETRLKRGGGGISQDQGTNSSAYY